METALYILHVLVCIGLLPIILLQSGKGGGVSATFGGGGAGTVFGSRGASTFLTKLTSASAVIFMCTSLGLSYFSSKDRSVVADVPVPAADQAAAPVEAAPAADQAAAPVEAAPAEAAPAEAAPAAQ
jgi:preprotein translocase subunit SecG